MTRTTLFRLIPATLLLAVSCTAPSQSADQEPAPASQTDLSRWQVWDLSYPFNDETIYWPTAEGFQLHKGPEGVTEKGYFYNANTFEGAEHGGTHLDAPYHFYQDSYKVGEVPVQQFLGPALVVDISNQVAENRDYLVTVEDLESWEEAHGAIEEGAIVLLHTGFGQYWPDAEAYLGTAQRGQEAVPMLSFPGLSEEAANWLAEQRGIDAVGIDTASIDYGRSQDFKAHVALARHNVLIFENVASMDSLPRRGAQVVALPMKIEQGSGAPLRIIALAPPAVGDSEE
ncbi:MAG TPA: cyclase family protein [Acidobacteriota bacterium]|nr:cyclase family protein [Acidobacteriota bacterium]